MDPLRGFRSSSVSFVTEIWPDAVFRRTASRFVIVLPLGISSALMRWKQLPVSMIQYEGLLSSAGGHAKVDFSSLSLLRTLVFVLVEPELAPVSVLVDSVSTSPGFASALLVD